MFLPVADTVATASDALRAQVIIQDAVKAFEADAVGVGSLVTANPCATPDARHFMIAVRGLSSLRQVLITFHYDLEASLTALRSRSGGLK